jgi:hypothetical protein
MCILILDGSLNQVVIEDDVNRANNGIDGEEDF